jgi:DNA polymerase-3 subunit delta'
MNNYWDGIYGQDPVKKLLTRIIDSTRIPHAFIFTGLSGIGKHFVAIRFCQALNSKFEDNKAANIIANFIANLSEPYIKYVFPLPRGKNEDENSGPIEKLTLEEIQIIQAEFKKKSVNPYYKFEIPKANNIKINSIRDIKKFLALDYSDLHYRIVLISDAHLMNEAAQNALLKVLEEPPEGVVFILTTEYPSILLETIRSRCWNVNFQPLSYPDIKNVLINYFSIEENLANKISFFSNGSITKALRLFEHNFEHLLEKTILILRYSLGGKFNSALDEFNEFTADKDSDSIKLLIQMIITWLNDVQKFKLNISGYYFIDYAETIEKFNKKFPAVELNNIVIKLENFSSIIQNNVNINLIILNIVYELSALTIRY